MIAGLPKRAAPIHGRMRERGFTLLEMLVAVAVFALLSLAGVAVLRFAAAAQNATAARVARIAQLQRAGAIIAADLAQWAPRAARDERGEEGLATFAGVDPAIAVAPPAGLREVETLDRAGRPDFAAAPKLAPAPPRERLVMEFVRRGWENVDAAPRASLQFVQYSVIDGRLERRARLRLDGAALGPAQVLASDLTRIEAQFRVGDVWMASTRTLRGQAAPSAVRFTFFFRGLSAPVRWTFLTAAEGA